MRLALLARPLVTLAFVTLTCAAANPARAQAPGPFTLAVRGVPLPDALRLVAETARIDLAFDPDLARGKTAYCVAERADADALLGCVLRGTGLDFYRLSNGTYVLARAALAPPRTGALVGFVVDAETGAALPEASVTLASTRAGVVAGAGGAFAFPRLAPGRYGVRASFVGFEPGADTVTVSGGGRASLRLRLRRVPTPIAPVVVDGVQPRASGGLGRAVAAGPAAGENARAVLDADGGADVARRLTALVGVRPGNVVADVHLQGGDAGEHGLRLDGVPVFAPPVLAGLVGPFSPFAVGRLTVQKAGFGAGTGSNTVGVVEAEHALGAGGGRTFDVQADPLSLNARASGAGPGGAAFLAAARVSAWGVVRPGGPRALLRGWNRADPFLGAIGANADGSGTPGDPLRPAPGPEGAARDPALGFYDVHAAGRLNGSGLRRLSASAYVGGRHLASDVPGAAGPLRDAYRWTTSAAQARYEAFLSGRAALRVQARHSRYRLTHRYPAGIAGARPDDEQANALDEAALDARLDYAASPAFSLEAGVEPALTRTRFAIEGARGGVIRHRSTLARVAGFANVRAAPRPWAEAELGVRVTHFPARGQAFAEPRASLRFDGARGPAGPWALRVAAGLYRQFVQQFSVSSLSPSSLLSSTRVWVGVDRTVAVPLAEHYSAELLLTPARAWALRFEAYYKHQRHLLAVDYAADVPPDAPSVAQRAFLVGGQGYAHGVTAHAERKARRATLSARYEYGHVERGTPLYRGNFYVVPWNEPHRFEAAATLTPARDVVLLARWTSVWGRAWGFRKAYYDYVGAYAALTADAPADLREAVGRHIAHYGLASPAEQTLPAFHQLDLGAAYARRVGAAHVQARLDVFNAAGRANVDEYRLDGDAAHYDATGLLRRDARRSLPFTALLALRLTWARPQ